MTGLKYEIYMGGIKRLCGGRHKKRYRAGEDESLNRLLDLKNKSFNIAVPYKGP